MNEAETTPVLPPPLPRPPRFRTLGIAAFGFAAASFGVVCFAFYLWHQKVRYVEGFPPGTLSGGPAFSLNAIPFLTTFIAIFLGFLAVLLLGVSCADARDAHQRVYSGLHVTTIILLLPSFYHLAYFAFRFISSYLELSRSA